ncbi:hypothetical protein Tco_0339636 [Tanacetum coccineum]
MEDEFYHLTVKGNDLKTYVRRFQELATLCPTMVPDSEKMMEDTKPYIKLRSLRSVHWDQHPRFPKYPSSSSSSRDRSILTDLPPVYKRGML